MASDGDDDQRGKTKMTEPHDNPTPRHGHARTAAGSNCATMRGDVRDRGRRDHLI